MKITITPTEWTASPDGIETRVWEGVTERGVPCLVLVHRLMVRPGPGVEQFEEELLECLAPAKELGRDLALAQVLVAVKRFISTLKGGMETLAGKGPRSQAFNAAGEQTLAALRDLALAVKAAEGGANHGD